MCPSQTAPEQQGRAPGFGGGDRACGVGGYRQEAEKAISPLGMEPRILRWRRDSVPSLFMPPQLSPPTFSPLARLPSAPHQKLLPFPLNGPPRTPQSSRGDESPGLAERTKGETAGKAGSVKSGVQPCASRDTKAQPGRGLLLQGGFWHPEPTLPSTHARLQLRGAGAGGEQGQVLLGYFLLKAGPSGPGFDGGQIGFVLCPST